MDIGDQGDDARQEEQYADGHGDPRHGVIGVLDEQYTNGDRTDSTEYRTLENLHNGQFLWFLTANIMEIA